MGHPHPTVDIPGSWPDLLAELDVLMPDEVSSALADGLRGSTSAQPGHVCATAWVLSGDLASVLLVRHRILGWSAPGGHLYPGETSLAAAGRELAEECGPLAAGARPAHDRPAFVHVTDLAGNDAESPAHRHWNVAWVFTVPGIIAPDITVPDVTKPAADGGEEPAQWWPCHSLPRVPADMGPGIGRALSSLRT